MVSASWPPELLALPLALFCLAGEGKADTNRNSSRGYMLELRVSVADLSVAVWRAV